MKSPRVVVVTGGGKGIGRAVVARFASAGDRVVAVGRDRVALEQSDASAAEVCDVTDETQVSALFERLERVDVLVNNAGISTSAPLPRTTLADWQAHLDVNATGAFLCTRAVVPGMIERANGRIVTVASTAALAGSRYTAAYTASKHAAVGLMRAVAAEVAGTGVTANAVCPAFVRTGDLFERDGDGFFWYRGRVDDLLKVGGIWVAPAEVEHCLVEHPDVVECAVVGHEQNGLTVPRAYVVARGEGSEDLARALQEHVRARLSPHKYPREVRFVDDLPKTPSGKLDRKALVRPSETTDRHADRQRSGL